MGYEVTDMELLQDYAPLYEALYTRKSCRKFLDEPLPAEMQDALAAELASCPALFPDCELRSKILAPAELKGLMKASAPHYLCLFDEGEGRGALNAGFVAQLWTLKLAAMGLGTVWLGGAHAVGLSAGQKERISIAFGRPQETITRPTETFKRKALSEIARGSDSRLEAARLAQSGTNSQPWFFIAEAKTAVDAGGRTAADAQGRVLWLYQKRRALNRLFYDFPELDMGIALAQLYLASCHERRGFCFEPGPLAGAPQAPSGFELCGRVSEGA